MLSKFRCEAAVLAAYLSQFDNTGTTAADAWHSGADPAHFTADNDQRRRDYARASARVSATDVSEDDVTALAWMRRTYGFPPSPLSRFPCH